MFKSRTGLRFLGGAIKERNSFRELILLSFRRSQLAVVNRNRSGS